ncbi:hypothetical protein [Paracoccus suum]|uniref:hypothetical protein n=1 Tax=Paracoccus suum TaxID=2259340 RepID=UPI0013B060B8|nr:hypothetical protein [Paracoccus suum]
MHGGETLPAQVSELAFANRRSFAAWTGRHPTTVPAKEGNFMSAPSVIINLGFAIGLALGSALLLVI